MGGQLCCVSDPVGQYRLSGGGMSHEREGKGKASAIKYD